jgi:transposase
VAAAEKKARRSRAALAFTDESGFLLAPLARRTLAPRGQTPRLVQRARHRDKVSVAAALTLSTAGGGHARLHYQTYANRYVDARAYAQFLRGLLRRTRGPVVLLHDGASLHKGPFLRELAVDFPRLDLNPLPPYAPEFNPDEFLFEHAKCERLANFVPLDVPQLERAVCDCMDDISGDQTRLRSFFAASELTWDGLTLFF